MMSPAYPKRSLYIDQENWNWLQKRAMEKKSDSVSTAVRQLLDEVRKAEEPKAEHQEKS
jgi:hypothetical protein